jgi:hypothetical protein
MNSDEVMAWYAEYEGSWRDRDLAGVERLFTEDAQYRVSPYAASEVGHDAIKGIWSEDEGTTFTADASPVAIEGDRAVLRVDVVYLAPRQQEYADLWLLRFAADGRVEDFEEWPFWPGKPYTAADE